MEPSDRYASILNTIIEMTKTRGMASPGMDAATLAYELLEAAASEAEVWGVPEQEIGLAGFDPAVLLKIRRAARPMPALVPDPDGALHREDQPGLIESGPKMLTPSEEDWLRQNLKETIESAKQIYRAMHGQQEENTPA